MIHVLAASEGEVLPVEQSSLEAGELHQIDGDFGVADVQEYHVTHLVQNSQLF